MGFVHVISNDDGEHRCHAGRCHSRPKRCTTKTQLLFNAPQSGRIKRSWPRNNSCSWKNSLIKQSMRDDERFCFASIFDKVWRSEHKLIELIVCNSQTNNFIGQFKSTESRSNKRRGGTTTTIAVPM